MSFNRLRAIFTKEIMQMVRDRATFAMIVGMPIMQLFLFGYAINSDAKHLPMGIVQADFSPYTRSVIAALENTGYFVVKYPRLNEEEAQTYLNRGRVLAVLHIPPDFSRKIMRAEKAQLLLEVDSTDPITAGNAAKGASTIMQYRLPDLPFHATPYEILLHNKYNPELIGSYNVVPGLIGTILLMTMVMMTALAIVREKERGTMENLLSTPLEPFEVMIGKILPFAFIGFLQVTLILMGARWVFQVPLLGSGGALLLALFFYILANLAVGLLFSALARTQLQSTQMAIFFFLPSILMSGFAFPFYGMPTWAQWIGTLLPLTHFLRIVRGVMLKGNHMIDTVEHVLPILLFTGVVMGIARLKYRRTLD